MDLPSVRNYVNGEWSVPKSDKTGPVYCPATGEKIAEFNYSTAADVDEAVKAAKDAFPEWRSTPPLSRARYLFQLKELMEQNFEDMARVLVTENGKLIDEARGEVRRAIENVEHATGVTTMMTGYCLEDIAKDIDCVAERQPMGVFAAIAPFNFPMMVPFWFLPYAIVTGNTFILKTSRQVPLTMTRAMEVIDELNLPPGVVNMLHGSRDVVNGILNHPDISGVSIVGSTPAARHVYQTAGATGKRVAALGGAKNFVVIMPDARIDKGMPSLITSFYGCAGQRCLAGSLLVGVGSVYDEMKETFVAGSKALKVGNGLDPASQMGPVISAQARDSILCRIEQALKDGAKMLLDGRSLKVPGHEKGFFVGPTVLENVTPDMAIAKEEVFGPVVCLMKAGSLDESIEMVNNVEFANSTCIYTQSGKAVRDFKYKVHPSMIGVNIGIAAPMSFFPFGGNKASMFGNIKAHGRESFQFYTDTKVVMTRWL